MKKQIGLTTLSVLLATSNVLAGGGGAPVQPKPMACKSIAQLIAADKQLSTLATVVQAADLGKDLSASGSFTFFAPSNSAFAKISSEKLTKMLSNPKELRNLALYHVVAESASVAVIKGAASGLTVQGSDIAISVKGKNLMINNATVVKGDIKACNGTIHIIDTVLMPPPAPEAAAPKPPAPKPPAPKPAPTATMTTTTTVTTTEPKPAAPVTSTTVTSSAVTATTAATSNTATSQTSMPMSVTAIEYTDTNKMALDVLKENKDYSIFYDLLEKSDLYNELELDDYKFTVFAPSNAAFEALPDGVLDAIKSNPDALKQMLMYHLVTDEVTPMGLAGDSDIKTTQGSMLNLGAASLSKGIRATDGSVYPIDVVLLPEDFKYPDGK